MISSFKLCISETEIVGLLLGNSDHTHKPVSSAKFLEFQIFISVIENCMIFDFHQCI